MSSRARTRAGTSTRSRSMPSTSSPGTRPSSSGDCSRSSREGRGGAVSRTRAGLSGLAAYTAVDSSIARGIAFQARPIFVGQVAVMLYGVVDTVLTGHASATDLAAMGLWTGVYSRVFVSALGAVNPRNLGLTHISVLRP